MPKPIKFVYSGLNYTGGEGNGPLERNPIRTKAFFDLIEWKISFWWDFRSDGNSF